MHGVIKYRIYTRVSALGLLIIYQLSSLVLDGECSIKEFDTNTAKVGHVIEVKS